MSDPRAEVAAFLRAVGARVAMKHRFRTIRGREWTAPAYRSHGGWAKVPAALSLDETVRLLRKAEQRMALVIGVRVATAWGIDPAKGALPSWADPDPAVALQRAAVAAKGGTCSDS